MVVVYLLRYKGCVFYITILLVETSKLVRNSREFAITVFVLTLIFLIILKGFCRGIKITSLYSWIRIMRVRSIRVLLYTLFMHIYWARRDVLKKILDGASKKKMIGLCIKSKAHANPRRIYINNLCKAR